MLLLNQLIKTASQYPCTHISGLNKRILLQAVLINLMDAWLKNRAHICEFEYEIGRLI